MLAGQLDLAAGLQVSMQDFICPSRCAVFLLSPFLACRDLWPGHSPLRSLSFEANLFQVPRWSRPFVEVHLMTDDDDHWMTEEGGPASKGACFFSYPSPSVRESRWRMKGWTVHVLGGGGEQLSEANHRQPMMPPTCAASGLSLG